MCFVVAIIFHCMCIIVSIIIIIIIIISVIIISSSINRIVWMCLIMNVFSINMNIVVSITNSSSSM